MNRNIMKRPHSWVLLRLVTRLNRLLDKHRDERRDFIRLAFSGLLAKSQSGGDYLEFGVYRGRALMAAYFAAQRASLTDMRFYAFDSFEGLPDEFLAVEDNVSRWQPG